MRITFRGNVEEILIKLCKVLNESPTEILTKSVYELEKQLIDKARTEEVEHELQKEPDKTL